MLLKKVGDWKKLSSVLSEASEKLQKAHEKASLQEAEFIRAKMVEGIREQSPGGKPFAPLADSTLAVRKAKGFKGSKALMVRGDLRNAIRVKQSDDGAVFIGVSRTTKANDGKSMVDIAEIHEFGSKPIVIEMTPRMRRFLMMAYRKAGVPYVPGSGTGIIVSRIPARPFIRPVLEKYATGTQVRDRIEERMTKLLKGVLSK